MNKQPINQKPEIAIIGAGLAGLTAALRARQAGANATIITMGVGGLQLSQGTIDVLGYAPDRVTRPLETVGEYGKAHPNHPYAKLSAQQIESSLDVIRKAAGEHFFQTNNGENWLLPTVVGAIRPTAWAPDSMINAHLTADKKLAIVGLKQHKDFYPELIAGNLNRTELPGGGRVQATAFWIDFPVREGEGDSSALTYARALDDPRVLQRFANAIDHLVPQDAVVCLPAVLGFKDPRVPATLSELLKREVAEIPGLPPSIPGMRLNEALLEANRLAGTRFVRGAQVSGFKAEDGQIVSLTTHAAGRDISYPVDAVIYAAGGFESGALELTSYGEARETIFDLPLVKPEDSLVHGDYWGKPQPLFEVGVRTNPFMQPVQSDNETDPASKFKGDPVYSNLYVTGGLLPGATRWEEKSGEGIVLGSVTAACDHLFSWLLPDRPTREPATKQDGSAGDSRADTSEASTVKGTSKTESGAALTDTDGREKKVTSESLGADVEAATVVKEG